MANDTKVVDGKVVTLSDEEQAERVAAKKEYDAALPARMFGQLREKRNSLLAETDYYALSDTTLTDEMKKYREDLRQLPSQYNDTTILGTITWPTKPS